MTRTFWTLLVSGALATIAFDLFGQGLSPLAGYATLAPVGLAQQTINTVTGINSKSLAEILHILTGLMAYPLGYLLVARQVAARVTPWMHWSLVSAAYGVGLWIFALYVMAHLVAGNPAFLGFTGITWVALWGHVLYGMVAAAVIEQMLPRQDAVPALA
ncbi:hypothetical protein [Jannaschia aquimarina]|uniref:DUF1440 domain-containing protein n=1 Tax=Jannaschia aquimarina TaxID=935700 RepID=A0A0D1CL17_9RHOB|nr:hypothetical protein [Jannaschia aquimarina]KIT15487.1 hypothetical protein jaqu_27350 [Jannaschia aquimarina]SNT34043.1 hypothetical protein SAMN05421775_11216 [Jannaschia aquimarina]